MIKEEFHLKEIEPGVFLLEFNDRKDLAYTFLRFQEYYENPHFSGKIFSWPQFRSWYKKYTKRKTFTYHLDWAGFNVPSYVLDPFYQGQFKNITKKEQTFLDLFSKRKEKFYVIGYTKGRDNVLQHETTHARFYINEKYRNAVLKIIKKYNVQEIYQLLSAQMYNYKVWDDELNAYAVNGWSFLNEGLSDVGKFKPLELELKKLHDKYFN